MSIKRAPRIWPRVKSAPFPMRIPNNVCQPEPAKVGVMARQAGKSVAPRAI